MTAAELSALAQNHPIRVLGLDGENYRLARLVV